jgi:hypothetical protein
VQRPATRQDLWLFIAQRLGVRLPWKTYTAGHSSPFGFVADAFFCPGQDLAAWASRSGGKTLGASILAALEYRFEDGLQGRVLSGSEDQARFLYEYWGKWCGSLLQDRLSGIISRQLTHIGGGRFEILAASQKRVRGPKVQRLYCDEFDEIDEEIREASIGMIDSRPGLPGRTVYASTWHRTQGLMGKLVAKIPGNGVRLHRWNIWESIARCPDDRHQQGRGCRDCKLAPACLTKAKELHGPGAVLGVAAEAVNGLYAVPDAIKAFTNASQMTWDAEYLCKRPSAAGLVYPDFDEPVHVVDSAPADLQVYRSIDWGYGVFVCLWLGVDHAGDVWLLDTYKAESGTLAQHAAALTGHHLQNVASTFCDPAGRNKNDQTGRSDVDEFRRYGIACTYTLIPEWREVANGIRLVRQYIKSASGQVRFHVVRSAANQAFVNDLHSYINRKVNGVYIDEPVKPQEADHTMDAKRYFFVNRMAGPSVFQGRLGAR